MNLILDIILFIFVIVAIVVTLALVGWVLISIPYDIFYRIKNRGGRRDD